MYELWCYAIDEHNQPIGGHFYVSADSNSHIDDLKKIVKINKKPQFDQVPADEIQLWKVLKRISLETSTKAVIKGEITQLKIPDLGSDELSTDDVQRLYPHKKLLHYWDKAPEQSCLHIIVRPPAGALVSLPTSSQYNISAANQNLKSEGVPPSFVQLWNTAWGNPLSTNAAQLPFIAINAMEMDIGRADEDRDVKVASVVDEEPHAEGTDEGKEMGVPPDGDRLPEILVFKGFLDGLLEIVIRADYLRAYDDINTFYANAKRHKHHKPPAAVVTGLPGIGKSGWIQYAIRRRLGLKLPTVLYRENAYIRFTESGVFKDKSTPYLDEELEEPYWCFIDSSQAPAGIPPEVSDEFRPGVFPIYVTSPIESRWKHLQHSRFYKVFTILQT